MGEYLGQSLSHTLLAALVIEALVRLWKIDEPGQRLSFRVLTLAIPVVLVPLLALLAPARSEAVFEEQWALFSARRWAEVRLLGVGLFWVAMGAASALGLSLLLLDVVPLLKERSRALAAPSPGLQALVAHLAAELGVRAPQVVLLEEAGPRLSCRGLLSPCIVISRGAVALLDPAELRVALAHELGHLKRHDPSLGWALAAARVLLFFNPVLHLVARTIAREAEWRADDFAATSRSDRLALASGLLKLTRAAGASARGTVLGAPLSRARVWAVEARARRLLVPAPPPTAALGTLRLALTGLCLSSLLYFVI